MEESSQKELEHEDPDEGGIRRRLRDRDLLRKRRVEAEQKATNQTESRKKRARGDDRSGSGKRGRPKKTEPLPGLLAAEEEPGPEAPPAAVEPLGVSMTTSVSSLPARPPEKPTPPEPQPAHVPRPPAPLPVSTSAQGPKPTPYSPLPMPCPAPVLLPVIVPAPALDSVSILTPVQSSTSTLTPVLAPAFTLTPTSAFTPTLASASPPAPASPPETLYTEPPEGDRLVPVLLEELEELDPDEKRDLAPSPDHPGDEKRDLAPSPDEKRDLAPSPDHPGDEERDLAPSPDHPGDEKRDLASSPDEKRDLAPSPDHPGQGPLEEVSVEVPEQNASFSRPTYSSSAPRYEYFPGSYF